MKLRFLKAKMVRQLAKDNGKQITKKAIEAFDDYVYRKLLKAFTLTKGFTRTTEKEMEHLG